MLFVHFPTRLFVVFSIYKCSIYKVKDLGHLSGYTLYFLTGSISGSILLDPFLFYSNSFQQSSKEDFSNHLSYLWAGFLARTWACSQRKMFAPNKQNVCHQNPQLPERSGVQEERLPSCHRTALESSVSMSWCCCNKVSQSLSPWVPIPNTYMWLLWNSHLTQHHEFFIY